MNENDTRLKDYLWSRSIAYSVEELETCLNRLKERQFYLCHVHAWQLF